MNEQDDILIAEDWWLKPSLLPTRVWSYDKGTNGGYIADYKSIGLDIRLVGTKNQINKWRKETRQSTGISSSADKLDDDKSTNAEPRSLEVTTH